MSGCVGLGSRMPSGSLCVHGFFGANKKILKIDNGDFFFTTQELY